jgi:hypothetical protein
MNDLQIKNLAAKVSNDLKWDAFDASKLFLAILTECNYHREKIKLEPIIKRIILNN